MSTHLWAAVVLLVFAGAVGAQTSVNFSQSVTDSSERRYLLEVDQGSTPTAVTVTIDLTTPSASGIYARLEDLDDTVHQGLQSWVDGDIPGAGSTSFNILLPARDGAHQIVLYLETYDWGPPSSFTGTASVSAGTVTLVSTVALPYLGFGGANPRTVFDRQIEYVGETAAAGTFYLDFSLDFGAVAHATTFFVEAVLAPGSTIRLLDMGASPPTEFLAWVGSMGYVGDSTSVTTPDFSGVRSFRVEYVKSAGDGLFSGFITIGTDVSVVSVAASLVSAPPPSARSGAGQSTCAASLAGSSIAPLMAALAFVRRRRRGESCGRG